MANDPAKIRIRHLRIKVYSCPSSPVSAVLPDIIVGAIKLQISHCVRHIILTCPYSCDVM